MGSIDGKAREALAWEIQSTHHNPRQILEAFHRLRRRIQVSQGDLKRV